MIVTHRPAAKGAGRALGRGRPPLALAAVASLVGLVFFFPGLYVLYRSIQLGAEVGETWSEIRAPLWRTVLLATCVSGTGAVLGTGLAFITSRTDVIGRRALRVLLVLPLVFPSFVGAAAVVTSLAPGGLTHELLGLVGVSPPRRFRGFVPAWFVLSMFTYPYVFLPVAARFETLRSSLEESARLLGQTPWQAFRRVTLPQLRPSIIASSMLVFLYTISDYGAVQILGYDTLTRVVFSTLISNRAVSFSSGLAVLVLAWAVALRERSAVARTNVDIQAERSARPRHSDLGAARIPASAAAWAVVVAALVMPLATLLVWSSRGIFDGRVDLSSLIGPAVTTATTGAVTGMLAIVVVLPVALLGVRHPSVVSRAVGVFVIGGFAVPGVVIALALVFWALSFPGVGFLYQTLPLLVLAYLVHFGAQALGATESAVRAVPDRLRESARLLDASRLERWRRVDMPLMRPGLTAGAGLVLLSAVKELPATLLLAPTGFDTLATEIWGSFEEGFYADAATSSLLLVAVSGVLSWWLILRRTELISGVDENPVHDERTQPHDAARNLDSGRTVG